MSRRDRDPNRISLLIRNLPLDCRADDVRYKFEKFGEIRDVYLPRDYYTGRARGFGFLEYRDPRDAEEAMYKMDRTVFMGREISVVMSKESRKTPRDMIQRERGPRGYDPPRDRSRDRRSSRSPRRSRSPRGRSRSPYERRGGRARSYSRSRSPPRRQDRSRSRSRSPTRRDSPPPRPVDDAPRSPGYGRPDDRADPPRRSRSRSRSPLAAAAAGSPRDGSPGYEEGQASGYRDREAASPEGSPHGGNASPRRRYDSQSP